jgi:phenylacetate-coenzyme A ligase PaaK-like adenylate-forming protein
MEKMITPQIEADINQRIRYSCKLAKSTQFYKDKAKSANVDLDEIKDADGLLKAYSKGFYSTGDDIPFITFHEDANTKSYYTSGSSGRPKKFNVNPSDEQRWTSVVAQMYNHIFNKEEIVLNCFPKPPAPSGMMGNAGLVSGGYRYMHAPAQDLRGDPNIFMQWYNKTKDEFGNQPTVIMSLFSSLFQLPYRLEKIGVNPKTLGFKKALVSGEPSAMESRRKIMDEMEVDAFDFYGTTENCLPAFEMEPLSRIYKTTIPDTCLFLVDESGNVDEGEDGEVVLNNLYPKGAIPGGLLLNYKIGDFARCIGEENGIVTKMGEIRRRGYSINVGGAKIQASEPEAIVYSEDFVSKTGDALTGLPLLIKRLDVDRTPIGEVRIESKVSLDDNRKKKISDEIKSRMDDVNAPVRELSRAGLIKVPIIIADKDEIFKGYEQYLRPGKRIRIIDLTESPAKVL